MTEDGARGWMMERFGADRVERVAVFLDMVKAESAAQNLIAPSTIDTIWARHALDSAQLIAHAPAPIERWLDIGTGGGFPGMVVAALIDAPVVMVEPRRRRADFLRVCAEALGLHHARVETAKVEQIEGRYDVISARAVASVEKLLQAAAHCATPRTRWVLPRGRIEPDQLAALRRDRQRVFHVEHSLTDPQSSILIVEARA